MPRVVAVRLRDRRAEAMAELLLDRLEVLSLALEIVRLAEMEPSLDQADEGASHNRAKRRFSLLVERLLDLAGREGLEDVLDLDVGEPCQHDAALLPLGHLFDVV